MRTSSPDPRHFSATLTLDATKEPVVLPQPVVVHVELIYPTGYTPDKEVMTDHLLRQQGIFSTPPFALPDVQQKAVEDSGLIHEKISYQLEPLLPGKFALSLFEVPFNSITLEPSEVEVVSSIVYVDVVLPESASIDVNTEIAPLLDLSLKAPIELDRGIAKTLATDHSAYFDRLFQSKAFPWQPLCVLLVLFLMTLRIRKMAKKTAPTALKLSNKAAAMQSAAQKLHTLQSQDHLKKPDVESFVVNLTKGVKFHFEEKLKMPVVSKTSEEFLREFENIKEITLEQKSLMQNFLQTTDRIKFEGYQPTLEDCLRAQTEANEIMREL